MLSVRHEIQHDLAKAIDLFSYRKGTFGSSDIFVPLAEI